MVTLTTGKPLGPGDLGLVVRDAQGALVDPISITYTIFKVDGSTETLVSTPKATPARASLGTYFLNITVPTVWDGQYKLVWYLKQYETSNEEQVYEEFTVVQVNPISPSIEAPSVLMSPRPVTKDKYAPAIMYVRELLSDENPDRNYHFRPPTPGRRVANFSDRVGYIWTDSTILRMLELTIAQMNTCNPRVQYDFTLDTLPANWGQCAALGAAAKCLSKEAARWSAEGFDYSLNGISISLNKAGEYQSLAESYRQEFQEWIKTLVVNLPVSSGLRQQRWLLG